jgi:hypothetical protein
MQVSHSPGWMSVARKAALVGRLGVIIVVVERRVWGKMLGKGVQKPLHYRIFIYV